MAKPIDYRKVGEGALKRCENCKNFLNRTSWCTKWAFVASKKYTCDRWQKRPDGMDEESDLKKRYRIAAGDNLTEWNERYGVSYIPEITEEDYEVGFITRYFIKQSNNPYGKIIEVDLDQIASLNTGTTSGLDGAHYSAVKVLWTISGDIKDVEKANTKISDYIEQRHPEMIGLKKHLYTNLLKFWEGSKKA